MGPGEVARAFSRAASRMYPETFPVTSRNSFNSLSCKATGTRFGLGPFLVGGLPGLRFFILARWAEFTGGLG